MLKENDKRRILIAPLDWGLGHATRCICIIKALEKANYDILIATEGNQLELLKKEFPNATFIKLFGYNITYAKTNLGFSLKIIAQIPSILYKIKKEREWLQKIIVAEKINLVISDNRYGLYSNLVPCVFITHQLTIKAPFNWLENILQKINYEKINKFSSLWVPDIFGEKCIAGELSNPKTRPFFPVNYIGLLSRFSLKFNAVFTEVDILVLLSGPEPQRSLLEQKIITSLNELTEYKVVIARGLPLNKAELKTSHQNVTIYNHLEGNELEKLLHQSKLIISRSGYTTIMELLSLQKKSILIPTPGQTEQEYLANRLSKLNLCYSVQQKNIDLKNDIKAAFNTHFSFNEVSTLNECLLIAEVEKLFKNEH